jgi:hypothetical protein
MGGHRISPPFCPERPVVPCALSSEACCIGTETAHTHAKNVYRKLGFARGGSCWGWGVASEVGVFAPALVW